MDLFLAATWGFVVLLGLYGWGIVALRLLGRPLLQSGMTALIGLSVSIVLGGVLGLFHLIVPASLIVFIIAGCIFASLGKIFYRSPSDNRSLEPRHRSGAMWMAMVAAVILVIAWRYLSSVKTLAFQPLDDVPGYIVFPVKMLQMGWFGPDPFSERRLAGLGGQPWTQSMVLCLFDVTAINLFDHGVALIILLVLVWQWLKSIGLGRTAGLSIILVMGLHVPIYLNCSSFLAISALWLGIMLLLVDSRSGWSDALLLAMMVAAICSLKSTAIPFIGTALGLWFIYQAMAIGSFRPLAFALRAALLTLVFLFPWMWMMRLSSGTLLCPILGRGYSRLPPLWHSLPKHTAVLLVGLSVAPLLAAAVTAFATRGLPRHRPWSRVAVIFYLAMAPIIFAAGLTTGGASWMRYSQPMLYGLMPIPLAALWAGACTALPSRRLFVAAAIALSVLLVLLPIAWLRPFGPVTAIERETVSICDALADKSLVGPLEIDRAHRLQGAVPPGEPILTRLDYPYLMNFVRNPVYIDDHPGLASPKPGMPTVADPIALSTYLMKCQIRYIAYSYGDEANFRYADYGADKGPYLWNRIVAERTFAFQDAVLQLKQSGHAIYDDGHNTVIDLQK